MNNKPEQTNIVLGTLDINPLTLFYQEQDITETLGELQTM